MSTFNECEVDSITNDLLERESRMLSYFIADQLERYYKKSKTYKGLFVSETNIKSIDQFITDVLDIIKSIDKNAFQYRVYTTTDNYVIRIKIDRATFNIMYPIYCLDKKTFDQKEHIREEANLESFYLNSDCQIN